jgi:hypothetical protein
VVTQILRGGEETKSGVGKYEQRTGTLTENGYCQNAEVHCYRNSKESQENKLITKIHNKRGYDIQLS